MIYAGPRVTLSQPQKQKRPIILFTHRVRIKRVTATKEKVTVTIKIVRVMVAYQ